MQNLILKNKMNEDFILQEKSYLQSTTSAIKKRSTKRSYKTTYITYHKNPGILLMPLNALPD